MSRVDDCIEIAERPNVILTTFGDVMRVPGTKKSLFQAKADGADEDGLLASRRPRARPPEPRQGHCLLRAWVRNDNTVNSSRDTAGCTGRVREFQHILQPHQGAAADQGAA